MDKRSPLWTTLMCAGALAGSSLEAIAQETASDQTEYVIYPDSVTYGQLAAAKRKFNSLPEEEQERLVDILQFQVISEVRNTHDLLRSAVEFPDSIALYRDSISPNESILGKIKVGTPPKIYVKNRSTDMNLKDLSNTNGKKGFQGAEVMSEDHEWAHYYVLEGLFARYPFYSSPLIFQGWKNIVSEQYKSYSFCTETAAYHLINHFSEGYIFNHVKDSDTYSSFGAVPLNKYEKLTDQIEILQALGYDAVETSRIVGYFSINYLATEGKELDAFISAIEVATGVNVGVDEVYQVWLDRVNEELAVKDITERFLVGTVGDEGKLCFGTIDSNWGKIPGYKECD